MQQTVQLTGIILRGKRFPEAYFLTQNIPVQLIKAFLFHSTISIDGNFIFYSAFARFSSQSLSATGAHFSAAGTHLSENSFALSRFDQYNSFCPFSQIA